MRPKPCTLPIVCPACRRTFHPTIEKLKSDTTRTCTHCGHEYKATKEFVEAMRGGEEK